MLAAEISFSQKPKFISIKNYLPWNLLSIIFTTIGFIPEWRKLVLHIWVVYSFWIAPSLFYLFLARLDKVKFFKSVAKVTI